jgi:methionyl-tRNA formyltransferase
MGTPAFANPSLLKLHDSKHQVVAIVTGLDKPVGRGRKVEPPPVKRLALELGYPVLQPASLKEERFQSHVKDMAADVFVVVAFRILPKTLLDIPPLGVVNLHPSLLPRYRGAAPIQHALLAGDTMTGVTIIALTPQIDAGDMLLQREHPIRPEDDFGTLSERLAHVGADLLLDAIDGLERGEIIPQPQPQLGEGEVPGAPKIVPADLIIHWDRSAETIANQIRAFSPKPGAITFLDGLRLKLFKPTVSQGRGEPGEILGVSHGRLCLGTSAGVVEVAEVQLEGRRRMTADEFARGTPLGSGKFLGQDTSNCSDHD